MRAVVDCACSRGFGETGVVCVVEAIIPERGRVVSAKERMNEQLKAKATF